MRKCLVLSSLVLMASLAVAQDAGQQNNSAQTTPNSSYSPLPGPGDYALPFVPLISTPTAALTTPTLQVGASDATGHNQAGAGNATLSVTPQDANPLTEPRISGDAKVASDIYPHSNDLAH